MPDRADSGWQRANIYDVAERAGVSHMTVSRVLNGHPNIREATRDRVLRAIDETNFTRSSIARALARKRAMRIGVLVDGPLQFGPTSTLRAIEGAARNVGYVVSTFSISEEGGEQLADGISELVAQGVDAFCVIAPRKSSLDVLREQSVSPPTIVIKAEADETWHTVAVDQRAGATMATSHLLDRGHRRILHLAGPLDWFDARERAAGWRDTMVAAGLPVVETPPGDWTSDSGYRFAERLDVGDATAIFVGNDQMALGVIHALTDRGIAVPADVSVIGFDDLPDSQHFLPPLTTIRQDFDALGALALRRVVAAIEGGDMDGRDLIEPELVVRESTAAPRG